MGVVSTCRTLLRGICLLCIASSAADRHGAFDEDYIRRQFQNEINSLQELDTKLGVAEGLATQEEEQVLIKLPANIPASPPLDAINSAPAMNAVPVVASAETVSTAPPIKRSRKSTRGCGATMRPTTMRRQTGRHSFRKPRAALATAAASHQST